MTQWPTLLFCADKDGHAYLWLRHGLHTLECLYSMSHAPLSLSFSLLFWCLCKLLGATGFYWAVEDSSCCRAELRFTCQGWSGALASGFPTAVLDCSELVTLSCAAVLSRGECRWLTSAGGHGVFKRNKHMISPPYNCPFKYCFPCETEPWHLTLVF